MNELKVPEPCMCALVGEVNADEWGGGVQRKEEKRRRQRSGQSKDDKSSKMSKKKVALTHTNEKNLSLIHI